MNFTECEKNIAHPMETVLDIAECTTVVEYKEVTPTQLVVIPTYDEKDTELENQYQEIYDVAMGNVATIADEMDRVEGKYKARIGEVTATMLNVALGAVREKSVLKMHKDKMVDTTGGNHTTNNTLVVADRNEILKLLHDKNKS